MTMNSFRANCLLGLMPEKTISMSIKSANYAMDRIKELVDKGNKHGQRNTFERVDMVVGFIQEQNAYTRVFERAMDEILGHHRHSYVFSFCDASYFYRANIPTILFGPGKMDLGHSTDEYTRISQVKDATSVFVHAIDKILGRPAS
jgi:acetylornithine deacetylase/succinyl-diaminopimelate desuccinylase-like protein